MNTHAYLLHGLNLAVSGEETILAALKGRLQQFPAAKPGTPSDFRFEFHPVPNAGYHRIHRLPGPNRKVLEFRGGEARYSDALEQLSVEFPGRARAVCDTQTGDVRISFPESEAGNTGLLSHSLFTVPLAELLKRHGLYMVHAAGLSLGGKGLLIAGAAGAGKTTLTIALLRDGFGFLGDDTIFLRVSSAGLHALAFPDEIDVTPDTIQFFPELRCLAGQPSASSRRKRSLAPSRVYDARPVTKCRPAVLVFPQVARAHQSALTPMPKDAAFLELLCNVLRTEAASAQAHLDALAALVKQCLCFRLQTGRDFNALPNLLQSALSQAASPNPYENSEV